jgi:hypothetical protein
MKTVDDVVAHARACEADEVVVMLTVEPDVYDLGYDSFQQHMQRLASALGSPATERQASYSWRDLLLIHREHKLPLAQRRRLLAAVACPSDTWKAFFFAVETLPVTRFPSNSDIHFRMTADRAVFRVRPNQEVACEVQHYEFSTQPRFKVCAKWLPVRGERPSDKWLDAVAQLCALARSPVP